ncbi:hypothetical protein SCOR_06010 [Sulfidibacter corallicola]
MKLLSLSTNSQFPPQSLILNATKQPCLNLFGFYDSFTETSRQLSLSARIFVRPFTHRRPKVVRSPCTLREPFVGFFDSFTDTKLHLNISDLP